VGAIVSKGAQATRWIGKQRALDEDVREAHALQAIFVDASLQVKKQGWFSPDFSPRGEPRLKVSMVNIRTARPQIHRFGTDAERGQSGEWEAVIVEKLRVLWSGA
jgi:hypothetical protein